MATLALAESDSRSGGDLPDDGLDVGLVRSYLASLLPPVMSATRLELEMTLFSDSEFEGKVARFASDSSIMVAYITKERKLNVFEVDTEEPSQSRHTHVYSLHLPPTPAVTSQTLATLSLIKKKASLDATSAIADQLHFVLLSSNNSSTSNQPAYQEGTTSDLSTDTASGQAVAPYEGLHSLVHFGVTPWFESYINSKQGKNVDVSVGVGKKSVESQMGIPVAKRKFAELELSLLHLQQNVEIPEVHLIIQTPIQKAVEACREAGTRVNVEAIQPQSLLTNVTFLNRLQSDVNTWIKEIQKVTKLSRDVSAGTASQEINFWLSMERALDSIEAQLSGDEVNLALDVLKSAKRFHATISFIADTGLKEATDTVQKYNALMKDFPLNELLSATDLAKIKDSLYVIFGHINKKLKVTPYPLRRTLPLVEAISRDFNEQCIKVLSSQRLMYLDYPSFERIVATVTEVFAAWEENIKEFTNVAREVMRKRSEKFIAVKINSAHVKLQQRIAYLRIFRRNHEQLRAMTGPNGGLKGLGFDTFTDVDMDEEISQSYEALKNAPILDVTTEGNEIWIIAETSYSERISRVENQIIMRLRDRLATARNAREMFRIFSKFNSLFVRPKIRSAIQEYQTRLIESVKQDIQRLHQKFTKGYRHSDAYHMSALRDLPPVASAIIWAKQIESQLSTDMKRVEDVLGKGWEMYAEGEKLKTESESFRKKLNPQPIFDAWVQDVTKREHRASGRLLEIVRQRNVTPSSDNQSALELTVNFDPQTITLFKEVRNLLWLNYNVPHAVINMAKEAKRIYPHAASLIESLRIYTQMSAVIEENPEISILLAEHRSRAQELINKAMNTRWESVAYSYSTQRSNSNVSEMEEDASLAFFREFASVVGMLQEKTHALMSVAEQVRNDIEELLTCPYTFDSLAIILSRLQKVADDLNLQGFANLDIWIEELDRRVQVVLLQRLSAQIDDWCKAFAACEHPDKLSERYTALYSHEPVVHELRLSNQLIYLEPPVEMTQATWMKQLQRIMGIVCGQVTVTSSKYELKLYDDDTPASHTYEPIFSKIEESLLSKPFRLIRDKVNEVQRYVAEWLQFQSLWDLNAETIFNQLGDALGKWASLLAAIKESRSTFDTAETKRDFGICLVIYSGVQGKVTAKYDAWQRDILAKYGGKVGQRMRDFHLEVAKARHGLETQTLNGSSTAQAVGFITFVQDLKRRTEAWSRDVTDFTQGQRTLERQRYPFPEDWLHIDRINGEWQLFNDILKRKDQTIQDQFAALQLKVAAEVKTMDERIELLQQDWDSTKPIQGDIKPEIAIDAIETFSIRLTKVEEGYVLLSQAQDAVNLTRRREDRLGPIGEEIKDLKAVWTALLGISIQVNELRETLWTAVNPRRLRQSLEGILASMREMPSRMRQYAAYEHSAEAIKALLKNNIIVSDLKSDALRDRHWRSLFQVLRIAAAYRSSSMTLAQVWDLNITRNEKEIKAIIIQAQGEMALEEYVRQVKDTWSDYTLDLINYRNKCRLIRGWDELFTTCRDQLTSLGSMRASPYYRVFEEEASALEDKLNRVNSLFDVWVDVQRQWVYLEGVFAGNADIKHLLPVEASRFSNINSEFLGTMAKVSKSPLVFDVLAINGIQKTFERLADALSKIQKALGEYLERERASFPRFFFLGDEDLLEIIGNNRNIKRVAKHLGKMFAGIRSLEMNECEDTITALLSKEGECIPLAAPIVISDNYKVNDWLGLVEKEMRSTLRKILRRTLDQLQELYVIDQPVEKAALLTWIQDSPDQLVVLAIQVTWTNHVEQQLCEKQSVEKVLKLTLSILDILADIVLGDLDSLVRHKSEHMIVELAHQRDVLRFLLNRGVIAADAFEWQKQMRFYHYPAEDAPDKAVSVKMADAELAYGFEYLGVPERLVQTPLTDKCYLTLTQALHSQCGGSPFGPAGTGKTESVKALGTHLGKFVLVFCCDETFDFQAMGRIFSGICQVGAWGCFDEFNRLEEKMLSAVSQQIQTIQQALSAKFTTSTQEIVLAERRIAVRQDTGVFITMNPDYAGRSQLPSNLKKLFRSVAMTHPDRELIAQVTLFAQGFRHAEAVASKIIPFFRLCQERLSDQPHYDFGLRALKAVLIRGGILKRISVAAAPDLQQTDVSVELGVLLQSIRETLLPKLIGIDVESFGAISEMTFSGIKPYQQDLERVTTAIRETAGRNHLVLREQWMAKVLQLYQIQQISHGIMLVGGTATGKTRAWQTLLQAMDHLDGKESVSYLIDPKAISKESLYGTLDVTTREWTDGLFTSILRKILEDARGESHKRHFIVFDGDVDPEWIENLNSVLDDNKLLTLPNGERLNLPQSVRILFEVEHLRYATPATVSRCGMIWFSDDVLDIDSIYQHLVTLLEKEEQQIEDTATINTASGSTMLDIQRSVARSAREYLDSRGMLNKACISANGLRHVMQFDPRRSVATLFSSMSQNARDIHQYDQQHPDFPLAPDKISTYLSKKLLLDIIWAFVGDADMESRSKFSEALVQASGVELPSRFTESSTLLDFTVDLSTGTWQPWIDRVPTLELDTHNITSTDVVIPTVDTLRHEALVYSWVRERKPVILCGPPGSGKTMTLFNALRKLPDVEVAGLNFSSATTPELVLRTFEQYCEYRKTPRGTVLSPISATSWLMVFCDEINLPAPDTYGTQRVISFIRQMVESNGFWRTSDLTWVHLERVQFIGACNPPTDSGRTELNMRFLRHAPILYVDYPEVISLNQIYGTYIRALLKVTPNLRGYAEALTLAMVDFYHASKRRFTTQHQAHYIYSPRELTRWTRGMYETLKHLEDMDVEGLVRVWAHEALRLFQDRLVEEDEKQWTDETLDNIAARHFPTIDQNRALRRPILFSNWTTQHYQSIDRETLREYTRARLRTFYEEELDVQLVLFDEVLEHVLRIDRVFRQSQGHMLLIGVSGSGKTTLSRFVAWMNGLSIFQLQVSSHYTATDFDEDLRQLLRRAGCKGEKICFIMDESNVLDSGFLERMNTLLANAEIPGLFEGDDYTALMSACREGSQRDGHMLNSNDELYRWFTQQVASNLHIVFTMNPPEKGLQDRATTSPALFNRCVLDWFGSWSSHSLYQVAHELTSTLDIDNGEYTPLSDITPTKGNVDSHLTYRGAVVNIMALAHEFVVDMSRSIAIKTSRPYHITPRHFLDFIRQYAKLYQEKKEDFEEEQRHVNIGLEKLHDTLAEVETLQIELNGKGAQLKAKNEEANTKLLQMVADQQEAEAKKLRSIQIQQELERQQLMIAERKEGVLEELEEVEPMVQEAAGAVANIKKAHLAEVRAMGNPPETVKMAMESACIVLGFKVDNWKAVQSVIRRDDFTSMVRNFDSEKISPSIRQKIERDYMALPNFNVESADRASKACGPLVQWVFAQVRYSAILDKVGPLRDEVTFLEHQAETTREQAKIALETVQQLEKSIAQYKDEYAQLISETQAIKLEMRKVQDKVTRSSTLLLSLSSEKERWTRDSEHFDTEMANIPGDVLLASIFLTYAGSFDQQYRLRLMNHCRSQMTTYNIIYRAKLSFADYLSSLDERSEWSNAGLAVDDLTVENALILKRFNRFPLIIDPSDQATSFLAKFYGQKKMIVTSFLDSAFIKNLETALRFGNTLLIQNAEDLDPILNTVLNKEIRRTGGRNLVRLGNQDVDFSPSFAMFLSTRNATVKIGPDLSSRTTIVNFSMTPSSLYSQTLDKILKVENPGIYARRKDLQKIQSEYLVRLRRLEKTLLQALNECSGNILEDDKVITTLETVKREAAEIAVKILEADTVMEGVERMAKEYSAIAKAASDIFFFLARLPALHHFYRFSLDFFLHIFDSILLDNPRLHALTDPARRRQTILEDLFAATVSRVKHALLHEDYSVVSAYLASIFLVARGDADKAKALLHLTRAGNDTDTLEEADPFMVLQTVLGHPVIEKLGVDTLKMRKDIQETPAPWQAWLNSAAPESESLNDEDLDYTAKSILGINVLGRLRKDRLEIALRDFTEGLIPSRTNGILEDMKELVKRQVLAEIPIIFCSVPGHDASSQVEALVATMKAPCISVAMGSAEGEYAADQAIGTAARTGSWVLLKNLHLASHWLHHLERRLRSLTVHTDFRLFLTMETAGSIPASIIEMSRVVMSEPPPGIKANVLEALAAIRPELSIPGPNERDRLYFLLAWLHTILQERSRYVPIGFTKSYGFNDSDLAAGKLMLDRWVGYTAKGRSHLDPKSLPWTALRTLLIENIYGGKVDSELDLSTIEGFVNRFIAPDAYEPNFSLTTNGQSPAIADISHFDQFVQWANSLPSDQPTSWLDLPVNSDKVMAEQQGLNILVKCTRLQDEETLEMEYSL